MTCGLGQSIPDLGYPAPPSGRGMLHGDGPKKFIFGRFMLIFV